MSHHKQQVFLGALLIASCATADICYAQTTRLIPFDEFYRSIPAAQSAAFVRADGAADVGAFNEMRQHILSLYSGVTVKHSFLLDEATYDCVPVAQQPSVRLSDDKTIYTPPDLPDDGAAPSEEAELTTQAADPQGKDALGNVTSCQDGTIPMRRVTLEDITRFRTLREFFQKEPGGAGQAKPTVSPAVTYTHKYAHSYEFVPNIGGRENINIWNAYVDTRKNEIFSLAQNWYSSTNGSTIQTLESGVQDFPQMYRTAKPALFIYWTADSYNRTGCYNLTCKGFVQTNSRITLGGTFAHYSVQNGKQYEIILKAYLYKGRWYIYLNGTKSANAIGYYPTSIYRGGQMSRYATEIDYGGETVGATVWPPMGSGRYPSTGYKNAAYFKQIMYFDGRGRAHPGRLRPDQPSPLCYKDATHNNSGGRNGTYFYFGGPGGTRC